MKKHTVLIVGGSGLIGQRLKYHFEKLNYEVRILSRNKKSKYYWDPVKQIIDSETLYNVNYIVNVCGSSIDKRWTKKRKKEIYLSRVTATRFLIDKIKSHNQKIEKYIGVSAIGYYNYDHLLKNENSKNGDHFLAHVCSDWELAISKQNEIPFCLLRLGVVLSNQGGMLKKLLFPFSLNLGSALGSGQQKISWIHIDDVCRMMLHCVKNEENQIFNCVSPNPISNEYFSKTLAKALRKKMWKKNIPAFILKILFGEMSSMILENLTVSSKKIEKTGFTFKFPDIEKALENLIN